MTKTLIVYDPNGTPTNRLWYQACVTWLAAAIADGAVAKRWVIVQEVRS